MRKNYFALIGEKLRQVKRFLSRDKSKLVGEIEKTEDYVGPYYEYPKQFIEGGIAQGAVIVGTTGNLHKDYEGLGALTGDNEIGVSADDLLDLSQVDNRQ